MTTPMILGYWPDRGLAGVCRNVLEYCQVPYKDRLYHDAKEWFDKDKKELGFTFPNLPYLIDGDTKLTQTPAILQHVISKSNKKELIGLTDDQRAKIDEAFNAVKDLDVYVAVLLMKGGEPKALKEKCFTEKTVLQGLELFERLVSEKKWLCGNISTADFYLLEVVEFMKDMDAKKMEAYPNLLEFLKRITAIPELKAYRESDRFLKDWYNGWADFKKACDAVTEEKVFTIGYWSMKGACQPARYLLEYCKVPYQEKLYNEFGEWFSIKETMGFDFPNLPYVIHGDKKITETMAIFQYIAIVGNKKSLLGSDSDEDRVNFCMSYGVALDLKDELDKLLYVIPKEEFEKAREESFEKGKLKSKLSYFNKYLDNKDYLIGKITIVDFLLFNLLDLINDMNPEKLVEYPKLIDFHKRLSDIPEIKEYRSSNRCQKEWTPAGLGNWTGL